MELCRTRAENSQKSPDLDSDLLISRFIILRIIFCINFVGHTNHVSLNELSRPTAGASAKACVTHFPRGIPRGGVTETLNLSLL